MMGRVLSVLVPAALIGGFAGAISGMGGFGSADAGEGTACIASVHDGDTFRTCSGQRVRLVAQSGPMDAPELPGSPRCHRCDPASGIAARDRLRVILRQPAKLHCNGTDRYKRALCRVTVNGKDVGDQLVREGYAVIRNDWR
jgi:endonuclease YncB( thermonuclease family)